MDQEIWKDIPGYDSKYQISNHGRVKSFKLKASGHIMSPNNFRKYMHIVLFRDGKKYDHYIAHLVAEAFCEKGCPDQTEVAHNDGNPKNNHWTNLRAASPSENAQDKRKHGTAHAFKKLDVPTVLAIRASTKSYAEIGREFNIAKRTVWSIKTNRLWPQDVLDQIIARQQSRETANQ